MDIGADEIRQWHLQRNFADIGYHYVIRRDGEIETGRPPNHVGAHVRGYNFNTLGICLIGGVTADYKPSDNFTRKQKKALRTLLDALQLVFPSIEEISGHRDFPNVKKDCPSFDVEDFLNAKV